MDSEEGAVETIRKLVLFIFVALLVGCTNDEKLTRQVKELQIQVTDLKGQLKDTQENIVYFENQAGVYQGCMWLVNICTNQMLVNGEVAVKKGFGGGGSVWFWSIVSVKILVLALAIPFFLTVVAVGIFKFGVPAVEEADRAKKMISEAEERAKQAEQATRAAEAKLAPAEAKLRGILAKVAEAEARLAEVKDKESRDLASLQAAKKALDLF